MLITVQAHGSRPPLFMVHGLNGATGFSGPMLRSLGADQPLYFLSARGLDGKAPPCGSVKEMAACYVEEILRERPTGPYLIGGFCPGSLAAMEVARELQATGRQVGPVLMLDPGTNPYKSAEGLRKLEASLRQPAVMDQLYRQALWGLRRREKSSFTPFDRDNPRELDHAAKIAVTTGIAFARNRPAPFYGAVELVLASDNARNFFDPAHAWQAVLPGPRTTHVIEGSHMEIFERSADRINRLIRCYLASAFDSEARNTDPASPMLGAEEQFAAKSLNAVD